MSLLTQAEVNLAPPATANIVNFNITQLIRFAITAVLAVAGIIFFFMLVLGGIKWIMSGGDKGNTEAARNQITAALIGLIIVFSAWAIISLVDNLFGISILSFTINSVNTF